MVLLLLLGACAGRPATAVEIPVSATSDQATAPHSTAAQPAEQTASPSPGPTETPSQLYLILGGEPMPIENGASVQLTDTLGIQVTIDPYPPIGLSARPVLDLYLFGPSGQPVRGAAIEIIYDMLSMAHGPFQLSTIGQGNGHYLTSLDLIMFGAWRLQTQIRPANSAEPVELTIFVIVALPEE